MKCGYVNKYVFWGLGSLKLYMAQKQICEKKYNVIKSFNIILIKHRKQRNLLQKQKNHTTLCLLNY